MHLVAYIARSLWHRRNDFVFNDKFMHPNLLPVKAQDDLSAFSSVPQTFIPICPTQRSCPTNIHWEKPPHGSLKVNWDAACNLEPGRFGFGAIIHDEQGCVLGTMRAV